MFNVLVILIVIASILMIGIVLIQKSKGGGLASNFASSNQIMGVRKTNSFVEKATWTLAGVVLVLSVIATAFLPKNETAGQSEIGTAVQQTMTDPMLAAPGFDADESATPDVQSDSVK